MMFIVIAEGPLSIAGEVMRTGPPPGWWKERGYIWQDTENQDLPDLGDQLSVEGDDSGFFLVGESSRFEERVFSSGHIEF